MMELETLTGMITELFTEAFPKGRSSAMTTIKDIARLSGYSVGTVSRVLNNHPDVSPKARAVISRIIEEENFQPNSNAKLLKQTSASAVTVFVKGTSNVFFENLLEKIQEAFKDNGEEISVVFLDETANEVETAIQICTERKPKGIVFLGGNLKYFRESFAKITVPCVLVTVSAANLPFDNLSSFTTDDIKGAGDAVGYLLRKGHKRIGIVGGSLNTEDGMVSDERISGAETVLKKNHLSFSYEKDYEPSRFSMASGYEATCRLLQKNSEVTGIFALSDMVAVGSLRAIQDSGLRVPEDISVIGFDGIEYTRYAVPRIATVRQDIDMLAKRTVEDLLMRISYRRSTVHEVIPYRVIVGESVAAHKP